MVADWTNRLETVYLEIYEMIYDVISILYCSYTDTKCSEGEFDLDLEDIMVMEAIWLSIQVIYRIKLPGPAILGEGKPENQNHTIIFTRGEGLQTIDMNQMAKMSVQNLIFSEYTHLVLLKIAEGKTSATKSNSKQEMFNKFMTQSL